MILRERVVAIPNTKMTRRCLDPWNYLEVNASGLKPCCMIAPMAPFENSPADLADARNCDAFVQLRRQLLSGDLAPQCQLCHIRPMTPVDTFQSLIRWKSRFARTKTPSLALPLVTLRIEVTMKCNLRCVYCGVSQPHYVASEMSKSYLMQLVGKLTNLSRRTVVAVNGHGETTYHPDWLVFCNEVVNLNFPTQITTNLARLLTQEEAECLAKFKKIEISIDTVDAVQLRSIRRHVKLENVLDNIAALRHAARRLKCAAPEIGISCVIYDASFSKLAQLAEFCIANDIAFVTFWQLLKHQDVKDAANVYPVPSLSPTEIAEAVRCLEAAIGLLNRAGIQTTVAGDFLREWRAVAGAPVEKARFGSAVRRVKTQLRRRNKRIGNSLQAAMARLTT